MKVAIPLVKNVLAPLGITAAASAIDEAIQKIIHGSGTTTLIISNEEVNDMIKTVQALEDSNIVRMNQDLMVFILEIIFLKII